MGILRFSGYAAALSLVFTAQGIKAQSPSITELLTPVAAVQHVDMEQLQEVLARSDVLEPYYAKHYSNQNGSSTNSSSRNKAYRVRSETNNVVTRGSASGDFSSKGGFPSHRAATGNRVFIFSPRMTAWAIYDEGGNLVKTGRASGGKGYCPDIHRGCRTPRGTFSVASKGSAGCRSTRYPVGRGGAPMPYCMFFSNNYAIHGSPDVPNHNASHGCIRVQPAAARWLHQNFMRIGTTVIVWPY